MIIDMQFINSTLYLVEDNGNLTKYDESSTQDWDGSSNVDVNFVLRLNSIKVSDRWCLFKNMAVGYTCDDSGNLKAIVDNNQMSVTMPDGVNKFLQRQVSSYLFGSGNNRGRGFSVEVNIPSGAVEVFDINMNIDPNIPQKSMIRGNK